MIVVYPGPREFICLDGRRYDRGVPTWVMPTRGNADALRQLQAWDPGLDIGERGRPIQLRVGRRLQDLPLGVAVLLRLREVFPTCPIEVIGSALMEPACDRVRDAQVARPRQDEASYYRLFDAHPSALKFWLEPANLRVIPARYQAIVGNRLQAINVESSDWRPSYPERTAGDWVGIIRGPGVSSPIMDAAVADLRRRGVSVRDISGEDVDAVALVAQASRVIAVGMNPLLWAASAHGVPIRCLLEKSTSDSTRVQLGMAAPRVPLGAEMFAYAWLEDAQAADPEEVGAWLADVPADAPAVTTSIVDPDADPDDETDPESDEDDPDAERDSQPGASGEGRRGSAGPLEHPPVRTRRRKR